MSRTQSVCPGLLLTARLGLAGKQRHGMLLLVLLQAATVPPGHIAALIGNDHVTANYPGFRPDPVDATALAAVGTTRGSMTDGIVDSKSSVLVIANSVHPAKGA